MLFVVLVWLSFRMYTGKKKHGHRATHSRKLVSQYWRHTYTHNLWPNPFSWSVCVCSGSDSASVLNSLSLKEHTHTPDSLSSIFTQRQNWVIGSSTVWRPCRQSLSVLVWIVNCVVEVSQESFSQIPFCSLNFEAVLFLFAHHWHVNAIWRK